MLGGMGGELETDLPFKLVHPHPGQPDSLIIYTLLILASYLIFVTNPTNKFV